MLLFTGLDQPALGTQPWWVMPREEGVMNILNCFPREEDLCSVSIRFAPKPNKVAAGWFVFRQLLRRAERAELAAVLAGACLISFENQML